jgi:CxxC motif-containing protein
MTRDLTCIVCPKGCQITVELDEGKRVISVSGHTCKRGEEYANTECTAPRRTITTTVAVAGGGVVPVKTDETVPKELMLDCMTVINRARVERGTPLGAVVIENILDTGANVITTKSVK